MLLIWVKHAMFNVADDSADKARTTVTCLLKLKLWPQRLVYRRWRQYQLRCWEYREVGTCVSVLKLVQLIPIWPMYASYLPPKPLDSNNNQSINQSINLRIWTQMIFFCRILNSQVNQSTSTVCTTHRAQNNGRSTDNVRPDRGLDRSNSHLTGHFWMGTF